jgi:hypothetical protein
LRYFFGAAFLAGAFALAAAGFAVLAALTVLATGFTALAAATGFAALAVVFLTGAFALESAVLAAGFTPALAAGFLAGFAFSAPGFTAFVVDLAAFFVPPSSFAIIKTSLHRLFLLCAFIIQSLKGTKKPNLNHAHLIKDIR